MTQEEKILLQDLCGRLPYGVKCCYNMLSGEIKIDPLTCINKVIIEHGIIYWDTYFENCDEDIPLETVRPYLRPLSSMTEEERQKLGEEIEKDAIEPYGEICSSGVDNLLLSTCRASINFQDYLNENMFDYRGLIPKGLALEATEGMYNN